MPLQFAQMRAQMFERFESLLARLPVELLVAGRSGNYSTRASDARRVASDGIVEAEAVAACHAPVVVMRFTAEPCQDEDPSASDARIPSVSTNDGFDSPVSDPLANVGLTCSVSPKDEYESRTMIASPSKSGGCVFSEDQALVTSVQSAHSAQPNSQWIPVVWQMVPMWHGHVGLPSPQAPPTNQPCQLVEPPRTLLGAEARELQFALRQRFSAKDHAELTVEKGDDTTNVLRQPDVAEHTTVMFTDLPGDCTRSRFTEMLNASGLNGCYDYAYCPADLQEAVRNNFVAVVDKKAGHLRIGKAFVNFLLHADALRALAKVEAQELPGSASWARIHGYWANVERFRDSELMHHNVPDECKPAVFRNGILDVFPPPHRPEALKCPKEFRRRGYQQRQMWR